MLKDHNNFLSVILPALKKTIKEYFEEYIDNFLSLDIEGFKRDYEKLLETEKIILENNKLTKEILELRENKDVEKIKQDNENLSNQVKYYKENYKIKNADAKSVKELQNKNKNLEFYSEMLTLERESLLKQIKMYNSINSECFKRIHELKSTTDKQYHSLNKIRNNNIDQENIKRLLGITDDIYEETISNLS